MKPPLLLSLSLLLALAGGAAAPPPAAAQGLPGGSGWVAVADGVHERQLEDGRVERIALGVEGWRWAVDRMADEEGRWGDLDAERGGDLGPDLYSEVLRLRWALDALDLFVEEFGAEEVTAALAEARDDCRFSFDVETAAAGGVPSSWVYPFGIRAQGTAGWQSGCGAEALVYARVEAETASPGISSARGEAADVCFRRGSGAACRAAAQATGFAPCRAEVRAAVAVPELALYLETEEVSTACATTPSYPDPFRY
jgi:hypothetical protein